MHVPSGLIVFLKSYIIFSMKHIIPGLLLVLSVGCKQPIDETNATDIVSSSETESVQEVEEIEEKSAKEFLVGNWQLIFDPDAPQFEGLSEEELKKAQDEIENTPIVFQFEEDGTIKTSLDFLAINVEHGTYAIEEDYITIGGDKWQFSVSETELVLDNINGFVLKFIRTELNPKDLRDSIDERMVRNARESAAKQTLGAINRSQQAIYLEQSAFTLSFDELHLGLSEETEYYTYTLQSTDTATYSFAVPKLETLKPFVGAVFVFNTDSFITESIICIADTPGMNPVLEPEFDGENIICPDGMSFVE